jgi:alanyl-tRNA synthetase
VENLLKEPNCNMGTATSVEFCGGTHLKNVSHIGHLVITSEEAIAKGTRRIIAITGPEAEKSLQRAERLETRIGETKARVDKASELKDVASTKAIGKEINEFIEVSLLCENSTVDKPTKVEPLGSQSTTCAPLPKRRHTGVGKEYTKAARRAREASCGPYCRESDTGG